MSLYDTLELEPQATHGQIRAAYRSLAQKHHPDKGGDRATMQAIQEAYDVLSDPERRAQYDATGSTKRGPSKRDQALASLGQAFDQVLDLMAEDLDYSDPVQKVRDVLHSNLAEGERAQKKVTKSIQSREKALRRLRFKGEAGGTLEGMLQAMIASLKERMEKNDQALGVLRMALDILAEYDYEVDAKPESSKDAVLRNIPKEFHHFFTTYGR